MSTSQNGWPALASNSPLLRTFEIPGVGRLRLRNGSAGFLLSHLAMGFDKKIEDVKDNYRDGELDDWGYAFRPVRGYSDDLSNHASGTAEDLNATEHPLGVDHTFTDAEERWIRRRVRIYEGCIRWGGDYSGRLDPMHFELDRRLSACEDVARDLMRTTAAGKRLLAANPGLERVIRS